jgi:beta-glucosidase
MPDIELPKAQLEQAKKLKDLGKKVIAVVFAGRPLAITELLPYCNAVLWAWHGGTMCGIAAAEILFGDFNPCGKLPVTIPHSTGQIPIFYNHNRNEACDSGYYIHRSYLSTNAPSTPLFVFGFGMSYTQFEYSNFEYNFNHNTNYAEVSFDIQNTGSRDGFEIAQCYVRDMVASMSRPVKELKAFKKVFLKAGEKTHICIHLSKDDLSFYNNRGEWIFESGDFKIEIGKSCNDICFETIEYIKL